MRIFPLLSWMLFPGCWAAVRVWGPRTVRGPPGGSVTVRCRYEPGYETYPKYWCRPGAVWSCSGGHLAMSDGTEAEVRRGRVSIRDNQTQHVFVVTVENLTRADTGTYRCGIKMGLLRPDDTDTVTVLLSPDDPPRSPTRKSPSTTHQPEPPLPPEPTSTWTSTEEQQSSSSTSQHPNSPGLSTMTSPQVTYGTLDTDTIQYILIPCVLLVLILFLLAALVLVRVTKRRRKALSGASMQRDKTFSLSNLGAENNAVDSCPDYELLGFPVPTARTGLYVSAETLPNSVNPEVSYEEIQPHRQGTAETEEVSYVTLTISTPGQQPVYGNTEQHPKAAPSQSPRASPVQFCEEA